MKTLTKKNVTKHQRRMARVINEAADPTATPQKLVSRLTALLYRCQSQKTLDAWKAALTDAAPFVGKGHEDRQGRITACRDLASVI